MNTLKTLYMVCEVTLTLVNPNMKVSVTEKFPALCKVIDDSFEPVGTPLTPSYPVIVDCSDDKTYKMLAPERIGIHLFNKGEHCERRI